MAKPLLPSGSPMRSMPLLPFGGRARGEKRSCRMVSSHHVVYGMLILMVVMYGVGRERLLATQLRLYEAPTSVLPSAGAAPEPAEPKMRGLTVMTLIYGNWWDTPKVTHNCRMIAPTRHRFLIYTDNMKAPYCTLCTCRPFKKKGCPRANPKPNTSNNCEKMGFVADKVREFGEIAYLDSDLVVMKDFFLDRLYWRSRAHDYLASYDATGYRKVPEHFNYFNSGLFFMRFLPHANYSDLLPRMYRKKNGSDQSITTKFVFEFYKNWDTLSWRWHCRNVLSERQDIPVSECYTIHDRSEDEKLRASINHTLLTIP